MIPIPLSVRRIVRMILQDHPGIPRLSIQAIAIFRLETSEENFVQTLRQVDAYLWDGLKSGKLEVKPDHTFWWAKPAHHAEHKWWGFILGKYPCEPNFILLSSSKNSDHSCNGV